MVPFRKPDLEIATSSPWSTTSPNGRRQHHGNDPHMVAFLQTHMRRHLASCINERQFTNFPEGRKHRVGQKRYREKSEVVSVYCVCWQPWARSVQSCGALVQCSQCKEWFHQACEGIDKDVLMQSKDFLWFCSQCNYS